MDLWRHDRTCPAGIAIAVRFTDQQLSLVGDAAVFGLVDAVVQQSGEEALLRLGTGSSVDVGSTFALEMEYKSNGLIA